MPEGPALGRALEGTLDRKLDGLVSGRDEELRTALALAAEDAVTELRLPGARVIFSDRPAA